MSEMMPQPTASPPDIALLLRVHGEQRWLASRVVPLVRQLERPEEIAPEDLGAALSYLEVMWLEAGLRASATDAAARELDARRTDRGVVIAEKAKRYHAAVRRLRVAVDARVRRLTSPPAEEPAGEPASS
jgi:hypothetical protein